MHNCDFYLTVINYCTTFKKCNFGIMSIYLHWKLQVDKYYWKKISSLSILYTFFILQHVKNENYKYQISKHDLYIYIYYSLFPLNSLHFFILFNTYFKTHIKHSFITFFIKNSFCNKIYIINIYQTIFYESSRMRAQPRPQCKHLR